MSTNTPPISDAYRKDVRHPLGHGYSARRGVIQAVIVHATHGKPGSSDDAEAAYLRDSMSVSAHYLIGRAGQILRILPDALCAWHAGRVRWPYGNDTSIGIELHAAASEDITPEQRSSLAQLLHSLMAAHPAITRATIDTHRSVAQPRGRKSDPASWAQAAFEAWRAAL